MRETLYIWPDADQDKPVRVQLRGDVLPTSVGETSIGQLDGQGRSGVLLLPAEQLSLVRTDVPNTSANKLRQAVPFLLEDQLADDIEQLHFALGDQVLDQGLAVASLPNDTMQHWLTAANDSGLQLQAVVPEIQLAPQPQSNELATVVIDGQRCLIRWGSMDGLATETDNLSLLLPTLPGWNSDPDSNTLRIYVRHGQAAPELPAEYDVQQKHWYDSPLELLDEKQSWLNLLQGDFAPQEKYARWLRPWRWVGLLLALLLVLVLAERSLKLNTLKAEVAGLQEQINTLFQQTFPAEGSIADLRLQTERQLKALRGTGGGMGSLDLLAVVAPEFAKIKNANITQLSYRNSSLDVSLLGADVQATDKLKQALQSKGLSMEVTSTVKRDKGTEIRLRIKSEGQ